MFFNFWGDFGDVFSLWQFNTTLLGRLFIIIKVKNYHHSDNFFCTVVQISIIALYMHKSGYNTIRAFKE